MRMISGMMWFKKIMQLVHIGYIYNDIGVGSRTIMSKEKVQEESINDTWQDVEAKDPASKPKEGFFKRFADGFKPAEVPANATEGMTEEEIKATMVEHAPLKRSLKARHISMLAIGGSIGSGLFIGSGNSYASGGPAGVVISFGVVGLMLFAVMQCLGELAVRYPVSGSFYTYSARFMDPSWGFALGWNYALQWFVTLPLELIAAALVLSFWDGDNNGATRVNKAAWIGLFYALIFFINLFGVRGYGEAEFVFALIKVIAVVGFCIFGIIAAAGGIPNSPHYRAEFWHDPGAFAAGFKGVCTCFVNAAFAFSGSEMAGLAASETDNPAKNLPRAVKQVFWRVMLFYLVSLTICSFLVPYNNPNFGESSDGRSSPFVLAIQGTGVKALPSIFNVVILISALSVGNTSVYACSRTLTALAEEGHAPHFLGYIDREGRPLWSVGITLTFGLLGFLVASDKHSEVFDWLLAFSGLSVILTYLSICWSHVRYRYALKYHGVSLDELIFKAMGGVYTACFGAIMCVLILAAQFWVALFPIGESPNAEAFFKIYLGLPVILAFYFGHKIWYRTPWYVRAKDMDVFMGTRNADLEHLMEAAKQHQAEIAAKPWPYRLWNTWC